MKKFKDIVNHIYTYIHTYSHIFVQKDTKAKPRDEFWDRRPAGPPLLPRQRRRIGDGREGCGQAFGPRLGAGDSGASVFLRFSFAGSGKQEGANFFFRVWRPAFKVVFCFVFVVCVCVSEELDPTNCGFLLVSLKTNLGTLTHANTRAHTHTHTVGRSSLSSPWAWTRSGFRLAIFQKPASETRNLTIFRQGTWSKGGPPRHLL